METLLEQQRRYHEERERLVDALVQERLGEKKTHKDAINSEHRQRAMLERYGREDMADYNIFVTTIQMFKLAVISGHLSNVGVRLNY